MIRAKAVMHGKTSKIHHNDQGVFKGLPNPFIATRYHSLAVDKTTLPDDLEITAWTEDGEIMGVQHKTRPVYGVQFHPNPSPPRAATTCWPTSWTWPSVQRDAAIWV